MWRAWKVATDRAARIRVYGTSAKRAADASRPMGVDPTGDHGLLFELISGYDWVRGLITGPLSYTLSPGVDFASDDGTKVFYIAVTNLSGATAAVATTFSYLREE